MRAPDMTGQRFKSWLVIGRTERTEKQKSGRDSFWLCQCQKCGRSRVFRGRNLRKNEIASCKCCASTWRTGQEAKSKYGCGYCLDLKNCEGPCKYADFFEEYGGFFDNEEEL